MVGDLAELKAVEFLIKELRHLGEFGFLYVIMRLEYECFTSPCAVNKSAYIFVFVAGISSILLKVLLLARGKLTSEACPVNSEIIFPALFIRSPSSSASWFRTPSTNSFSSGVNCLGSIIEST